MQREIKVMSTTPVGVVVVALVVGVVAVMALAGCGGQEIAERIAENRIEAEGGGDVDIDFDDGDISVKTEDGEFSIKTDDDGNVSVQGAGDDDGETFSIESQNGETVIETDNGTATVSQGSDLPDDFPAAIPIPDGLTVVFSQRSETPDGIGFIVSATTSRELASVVDDFTAGFEANGFEQQQLTTTPDGSFMLYTNGDYGVNAAIGTNSENTTVSMTVVPQSAD